MASGLEKNDQSMTKPILQAEGHAPGIYIGMSHESYLKDPAISRSDIMNLLEAPHKYWLASWMNSNRRPDKKETASLARGTAFHALLLEPDKFFERYVIPGMMGTYDGDTRILLKRDDYLFMRDCVEVLLKMEYFKRMFSNGLPEVCLFWRDPVSGLMMKCRHDYMRVFGSVDYKNTLKTASLKQFGREAANYGYDIQAAIYTNGNREVRKLLKEGTAEVQAEDDSCMEFLERYRDCTKKDLFAYIYQEARWPYVAQNIIMTDSIIGAGQKKIETAVDIYLDNFHKYGNGIWMNTGEPQELDEYSAPAYLFNI